MPTDESQDGKKNMGAKRRSENRERQNRVTVRFLDAEYEELKTRADAAGLSVGGYLRASSLGKAGPRAQRSPHVNKELAARAIAELNKAGSNLNQIAHALNTSIFPAPAQVAEASAAVRDAARQILEAFGFKAHDR